MRKMLGEKGTVWRKKELVRGRGEGGGGGEGILAHYSNHEDTSL